jgi:hypothetical protein
MWTLRFEFLLLLLLLLHVPADLHNYRLSHTSSLLTLLSSICILCYYAAK